MGFGRFFSFQLLNSGDVVSTHNAQLSKELILDLILRHFVLSPCTCSFQIFFFILRTICSYGQVQEPDRKYLKHLKIFKKLLKTHCDYNKV